jgi:polysaccharide export outer membrane protein
MSGIKNIVVILVVIAVVSSCVPNKKVVYVQDSDEMAAQQVENMYFIDEPLDDVIRQGDELYIKVTSADETQTNFNQDRQSISRDPSLLSYSVDDEGNIKLPYINRVKLSGLTLVEASDLIEEELSQYLLYPSVFIRFVNNKVTILGEVNSPGVYIFNYKSLIKS